jgi:trehalose-6-phosphate synthase
MEDIKKILEYAKYTFGEAEKVKEYAKYIDEKSEEVKDVNQTFSDTPVRVIKVINDHIAEIMNIKNKN